VGHPPGDFYRKTLNSEKTITYSWDLLHRLTGKAYSDSTPGVAYYYDQTEVENVLPIAYPYGRMTSALSQTSSGAVIGTAFSYDPMGRVLGEWSCTPLTCPSSSSLSPITLQFTFDFAGDLTSLTNASDDSTWEAGVTWNYTYDATPNLTEITTNATSGYSRSPLFSTTTYGPAGNLTSAVSGDENVSRSYGYDKAFRLNSINLSGGLIGSAQNWSVGYYGNNSVQSVADPVNGSWSYGYDKFNRISTASCSGSCPYGTSAQTMGFTYDQYGNRWTQSASPQGINPSFSFNTKNQITSGSGVVYDSDGNLTNDGNGNTFSFDPEGKLTASVVGGVSSTYKNDPFGQRAESVTSAGTFDYVYDPSGRLITEADTTCNSGAPYYPCTDFVYIGASSIPFSQFSDPPAGVAAATFNYYDYMGSLRETTSYLGLSSPYQGDPFGDSNLTPPNWFGFAEMLTMGSGVQLSSTRGYHQIEARWLSPDPAGMAVADAASPQSWNRYAYVLNNPTSFIDPTGLECYGSENDEGCDESMATDGSGQYGLCYGANCDYGSSANDIMDALNGLGMFTSQDSSGFDDISVGSALPPDGGYDGLAGLSDTAELISGTVAGSAGSQGSIWDACGSGCGAALGWAANFSAGAGDALTLGLTRVARGGVSWIAGMGYGDNVNYGSGTYWAGLGTGAAVGLGLSGPSGPIFGTRLGGNTPLLNSSTTLRVGWSYMRSSGIYSFRIGGTLVGLVKSNPHINLWPPSMWFW